MKKIRDNYAGELKKHQAKMEALLLSLFDLEKITMGECIIYPNGGFSRGYLKDIKDCTVNKLGKKFDTETLYIEVNREGLFDAIPRAVFHQPEQTDVFSTIERYAEETRRFEEEEKEARAFFLPIEQAFFKQRLAVESQERSFISGFSNPLYRRLFADFYASEGAVQTDEVYLEKLIYLMPLAHLIAGNRELLAACLEISLDQNIRLHEKTAPAIPLDDFPLPGLGTCTLGVDSVLGGSVINELKVLAITVGPIALDSVKDYLPGGYRQSIIQFVRDYFIPLEWDLEVSLVIKDVDGAFRLLPGDESTARLGYSSVLN